MEISPTEPVAALTPLSANFVPLSPLDFLSRSADVCPDKIAVIHGDSCISYSELRDRATKLAGALSAAGISSGDVVSVIAPNVPEMLEAQFGVPLAGAVLNAINTRLDAPAVATILNHTGSKLVLAHHSFEQMAELAINISGNQIPLVIIRETSTSAGTQNTAQQSNYEAWLEQAPSFHSAGPENEWHSIALKYTSGTTGKPNGAVYSHRGHISMRWGM